MPTAGLSHLPGVRIRDFFAVEKLTVQEEKRVAHCLPGPYREATFRKPLREVAPLFTQSLLILMNINGPPGTIQLKRKSFTTKKIETIEN